MSDAIFTTRQTEPPKAKQQFSGGPTANRPPSPARWLHYFDTDLNYDVVWDGTQWRPGTAGPAGPQGIQGAVSSVDITGSGFGVGLIGNFFANTTLSGSPALTLYQGVNLHWADGGPTPNPAIPAYSVSGRWTGVIQAPITGALTFSTLSDDGIRLWLDNVLVINNWTEHAESTDTAPTFHYLSGQQIQVKLEWFQGPAGPATMKLFWTYPGQPTTIVPLSRMSPSQV